MARRKRLTPPDPTVIAERGSANQYSELSQPERRAPIAGIAADAAATAALREVSSQMIAARQSGRMVISISLENIQMDYLVRDRLVAKVDEMTALVESIRNRGQQIPIEVVELGHDQYGLIAGWRRCQALAQLAREAGSESTQVLALIRKPAAASDAYLAMIEENEIRVGLSYFERARIVIKSVEHGVFDDKKQALTKLFGSASRAKRSKIGSFMRLVEALDDILVYPQNIGERLGLRLAKLLESDDAFTVTVKAAYERDRPTSIEAEQVLLNLLSADKQKPSRKADPRSKGAKRREESERQLRPGLNVRVNSVTGAVEISGEAMTSDLRGRLLTWLARTR